MSTATLSDAAYVALTRAKGKCGICGKKGADTVTPLVPASYGGSPDASDNVLPAHTRCAALRHQIEGSSPEPPDPEGLARVRRLIPRFVDDVLYRAAIAHQVHTYNSVDAITLLGRRIEANIGVALRGLPCPAGMDPADWAWLGSSEAYDALHSAAWALLASEG